MGTVNTKHKVVISLSVKIDERNFIFSHFVGPTEIKAKNYASQRALKKLCHFRIESRAVDRDSTEPIHADKIEK